MLFMLTNKQKTAAFYRGFSIGCRKICFDSPYYFSGILYVEIICSLQNYYLIPVLLLVLVIYCTAYRFFLLQPESEYLL